MHQKTIQVLTRLFLDTRMLCADGQRPPDAQFEEALALLNNTRAEEWLRYCANTLQTLVHEDCLAAYAFADAVHNTRHLPALDYGVLLWAQTDWDIDIQPFRDQYGQTYFSAFLDCVWPDEEVHRRCWL